MKDQALDNVPSMEQPVNFDFSRIDAPKPDENFGLFKVKPANEWIDEAKNRPVPRMLFDCLWYEGELCILFADTNLGKSILAVQIADSISKGRPIPRFRLEANRQPVIYLDFELSDKQFEARYSDNFTNHYRFDDNLLRVEINPDADISDGFTFEEMLNASLDQAIIETGAKVLIVDNLTYLREGTEKAKDALPLMKQLKSLKSKCNLSILALAHTPKRVLSNPLTRNDLQGSKMLINFCDSAFAIGESFKDKRLRYIKQIKQRNCEAVFDADNVAVCEVTKPDNFLHFSFIEYGKEKDHLRDFTEDERGDLIEQAKQLRDGGLSQREIADRLKVSVGTINNYLKY